MVLRNKKASAAGIRLYAAKILIWTYMTVRDDYALAVRQRGEVTENRRTYSRTNSWGQISALHPIHTITSREQIYDRSYTL